MTTVQQVATVPAEDGAPNRSGSIDSDGGSAHRSEMEAIGRRLDGVEREVAGLAKEVSYVKWSAGLVGAAIIASVAFLGTQVSRLDGRVDRFAEKLDSNSAQTLRMEGRIDRFVEKIDANSAQVLRLESRIDRLADKIETTAAQISALSTSVTLLVRAMPANLPSSDASKPAP